VSRATTNDDEYSNVEEDGDGERDEERTGSRVDDVARRLKEVALVDVQLLVVNVNIRLKRTKLKNLHDVD